MLVLQANDAMINKLPCNLPVKVNLLKTLTVTVTDYSCNCLGAGLGNLFRPSKQGADSLIRGVICESSAATKCYSAVAFDVNTFLVANSRVRAMWALEHGKV